MIDWLRSLVGLAPRHVHHYRWLVEPEANGFWITLSCVDGDNLVWATWAADPADYEGELRDAWLRRIIGNGAYFGAPTSGDLR